MNVARYFGRRINFTLLRGCIVQKRSFNVSCKFIDRLSRQNESTVPQLRKLFCTHPQQQQLVSERDENSATLGKLEGKYRISYTCNVCEHRSHKIISKQAYTNGVVIVKCDQCENNHLIADNLGWFYDDKRNIEDIIREKGGTVMKVASADDLQLVPKE